MSRHSLSFIILAIVLFFSLSTQAEWEMIPLADGCDTTRAPLKNLKFTEKGSGEILLKYHGFYTTRDGGANWSYDAVPLTIETNGTPTTAYPLDLTTRHEGDDYILGSVNGVAGVGIRNDNADAFALIEQWSTGGAEPLFTSPTPGYAGILQKHNNTQQHSMLEVRGAQADTVAWTQQHDAEQFRNMMFLDENTGYAVGIYNPANDDGTSAAVWKTRDGGRNWTRQSLNAPDTPSTLFFLNETTGFVAGSNGMLYKTSNGGANWQETDANTQQTINAIYFKDASHGAAAGNNNTLLTTTDGGQSWTAFHPLPMEPDLTTVFVHSNRHVYAGGTDRVVFRSASPIEDITEPEEAPFIVKIPHVIDDDALILTFGHMNYCDAVFTLYDMNGNIMANETLPSSGEQVVHLNGIEDGTYPYILEIANITRTGMIQVFQ